MQRFLAKVMVDYLTEILVKDLDQDHRTSMENLLHGEKAKLAAFELQTSCSPR